MVDIAIISFAKFKTKQSRASMSAVINYAMNPDKTSFEGNCLVSGLNCSPQTVYHEFINTKLLYGKDSERMYYHMTQFFPKGEAVPPKVAHEMAIKLAAHFKDYEVLICTHLDRAHVHSHFIINSVSFETGRKFHISTPELEPIRQLNDKLCTEYGFEICKPKPKPERTKSMSVAECHAAAKGESWKMRLINTINSCMKHAGNKAQFALLMELEGYSVKWTDTRKNITYITPQGKPCRDDRLHESKYLKERMELELRIREEIINGRTQTAKQTDATRPIDIAAANTLSMFNDTTGCGRAIRAAGSHTGTDESLVPTESQLADEGEHSANADGAGSNQPEPVPNTADTCTGWEKEREAFFNSEATATEFGMDTAMDSPALDLAGIGSNLVQLGRAVEQLDSPIPVKDVTTVPQPNGKHRKLAVGQKEDDHSGYNFEMKM